MVERTHDFLHLKNTPVEFRLVLVEFWVDFFLRAPSIEVTLLRKGHLVHVRATEFASFAGLFFADRRADVSPKPKTNLVYVRTWYQICRKKLFLIRS